MATTVNCPRCGTPYEIAGVIVDDKPLLCMTCGEKFSSHLCAKTMTTPTPPAASKPDAAAPTPRPPATARPQPASATAARLSAAAATIVGTIDDLIGKTIGGCRLEKKLGQGGMGAVYLAKHLALDIPVAIKILPPEFAAANPGAVERFIREARAAAKLQHQNIVGVMNVGQEQGLHFIVMQYVDGGSLQSLLRQKGRLPWRQATDLIIQVCEALKIARENGIVHRDIKPDNIMLDSKGTAKLADLGLAKFRQEDAQVTQSGMAMGTPHYMAPEQAEDAKKADHRSDIYSLGCTLYHMLTGKTPYAGESVFKILQQHVSAPIPDLCAEVPDAPAALGAVLRKAMAKKPAERFQTADELQTALKKVRAGQMALAGAAAAKNAPAAPAAGKASASGRLPALQPAPAGRKSTRILPAAAATPPASAWVRANLPAVIGAGAAIVILAAVTVGLLRSSSPRPETVPVTLSPNKALMPMAAKTTGESRLADATEWRAHLAKASEAWEANRFDDAMAYYEKALALMADDATSDRTIIEESQRAAKHSRDICRFCVDRATAPLEVQLQVTAKKMSEMNKAEIIVRSHKSEGGRIVGLDLSDQPALINIDALRGLALSELDLAKTSVQDLAALRGMPLRHLNLSSTAVKNLEPLKGKPLTELDITNTKASDLAPMQGMELHTLIACGAPVADLAALKGMASLRKLSISQTAVENLAPLAGMSLETLEAEQCRIADIAALKDMPLKHLALAGNPVRDLTPLAGMPLETLTCETDKAEKGMETLRALPALASINGMAAADFWAKQGVAKSDDQTPKETQERKKDEIAWPAAEGKTIDLLPLIKPEKHTAMGAWQWQNAPSEFHPINQDAPRELCSIDGCAVIPYRPAAEYDLRLLFSTPASNRHIYVVLTVPERKRAFAFAIKNRDACGFEAISGGLVPQNSSSERLRNPIGGSQYALALQVRKTGVQAFLDGEAIAQYKTANYAPFTLPKTYPPPPLDCLEVGCVGGIIIRRLEAVEITGKGEVLDIMAQHYAPPPDEPKPTGKQPRDQSPTKTPTSPKPKSSQPRSDHRLPPSRPSSSPPSHGSGSSPPKMPHPPGVPPPPPMPPH